ncbi:hypothetical protein CLA01_02060 [Chryseobacterium lathyri]|uniref:Tryptophan synthase beta chain n=2 Tax=Chryseobacterium lathyri TaxID=395933 RepID=A0A511Y4K0_9FLAO|nr:hypothetical protein CLA01_02060 [Chryseobacterium lathyri]
MNYQIKKSSELTDHETQHILSLWEVPEWSGMTPSDFRSFFKNSEFHFISGSEDEIPAIVRLNFDFFLEISGKQYSFAEAVGLVSAQKKRGYGSQLVQSFKENLIQRKIETIGFCFADLRPFYQQCNIEILENKAKAILENSENRWISSEDDDILIFNGSGETRELLRQLNPEKNAYLITKNNTMNYKNPDEHGYYGEFGGAFIPEMLYPNVEELQKNYLKIIESEEFQDEYQDLLKNYVGRATPLYFAKNLSRKYNTQIYLKREDLNHTGAHKINNALGQVLLAKRLGKTRIIAETGAGQHGVATATACALLGLECIVYMGEIDIQRQAPNVARMKMLGAEVIPATSGSKTLKDAVNEALRDWINNPVTTHYVIGSVVGPHPFPDLVARFQSIISKEIREQLKEKIGRENPDYVIACVGGGSNAAGTFYHFVEEKEVKIIAAEAGGLGIDSGKSAATTFLGTLGVLHGSKSLVMQTEDGQVIEPHSISAGLDYPGIGPFHAHLFKEKRAEFFSINDEEALQSAFELTKLEGIIPALESSHALAVLDKKKFREEDIVVICLSGRGDKDMETYLREIRS